MQKIFGKVVGCTAIACAVAEIIICIIQLIKDFTLPGIIFFVPLISFGIVCCILFGFMVFYAVFIEK